MGVFIGQSTKIYNRDTDQVSATGTFRSVSWLAACLPLADVVSFIAR
jgi:hypothetical protein